MKKVLLVEDNAANRKLLGDLLRRAGHEVKEVETADDGITGTSRYPSYAFCSKRKMKLISRLRRGASLEILRNN